MEYEPRADSGGGAVAEGREREAVAGLITCGGCRRYFRVEAGVPSLIFAGDGGWLDAFLKRWGVELEGRIDRSLPRDDSLDPVLADGDFWARFYRQAMERGYLHFLDIRQPLAPLYLHGVVETLHFSGPGGRFDFQHQPFLKEVIGGLTEGSGALPEGSHILEIGCGSGWLCLELARRGLRPTGLDTGFQSLVLARLYARQQGLDIDYVHADGGRLPFAARSFQGLVGFQALHHIPRLLETARELREILEPGALTVIFEHRAKRPPRLQRFTEKLNQRLFLLVAGRHRIHPTFPATLSENEDCSLHLVDEMMGGFQALRRKRYFLFLQDLPGFAYLLAGHSRLVFNFTAALVNGVDRVLTMFWPSHCEHVLQMGRNRRETE
jgi:2-polyprenyl-3-methyl-5-hydroxy-6-metoxy-1,4-benzoquinol methylase